MHLENDRDASQNEVSPTPTPTSPLRALCIARHCILSEHIARYFAEMGVVTTNAVGLESVVQGTANWTPDVVICDYDVLATVPLEQWEQDRLLSQTPVVAVSLTRHAEELHLLDVNGIAGFLYLPTLDQSAALRILYAAAARPKYSLPAPTTGPRVPSAASTRPVEHS
jgi:DNA-binding NarL/FixJ family response regulator